MILDKFSLKGKSGIVTGGGTGLGKAMATAVVQAGGEILIVGRRKEVLEEAAREMNRFGGSVIPFQADITKMGDIPKIVAKAIKEFGKIDFLFNNAGKGHPAPCEDYRESDWDEVLMTNLKGPFFLAQAVGRNMISAKRPGSIINISSIMAFITLKDSPAYPTSKAAISQLTKALANSWAKYGIRVNAIGPGWFRTEMTQRRFEDKEKGGQITSRIPLGRTGDPDELGGVAVFLASDASSYVTGQTIVVDGGLLSTQ
jgi:NAD(P)-dependent dehydrogenase (short-subunit alcohol dehydrogenase family)